MNRSAAISYLIRTAGVGAVAASAFGGVMLIDALAKKPYAHATGPATSEQPIAKDPLITTDPAYQASSATTAANSSVESELTSDSTTPPAAEDPTTAQPRNEDELTADADALFANDPPAIEPSAPDPVSPDSAPTQSEPSDKTAPVEPSGSGTAGVQTLPGGGGGGGGAPTLGGGGGGGGSGSGGGGGGTGIAGNPKGLAGPALTDTVSAAALLEDVATFTPLAVEPPDKEDLVPPDELLTLSDHPDPLTEAELDTLVNDIKTGAVTIAPNGSPDETTRLQNAFDAGGDIVLQTGDWPTQPVRVTQDGTRLFVEDGGALRLLATGSKTEVIEIAADNCIIIGLTADGRGTDLPRHRDRHESILVTGDSNRLIDCTAMNSGRIDNTYLYRQTGFSINGNENTIESCTSHDAGYAGLFNRGDNNLYRNCSAYNYGYKGFNQGHFRGRDVARVTIDGWYAESNKGNGLEARINGETFREGAIYPIGLQIDTNTVQVRDAVLRNIRVGAHPRGIGSIKLAAIDKITIDEVEVTANHPDNSASIIFAESVGEVTITNGTLRRGITHFPFDRENREPVVQKLTVTNVTLGGDEPVKRPMHDHLMVRTLVYENCTFLGLDQPAFAFETPDDKIASWKISGCTFVTPLGPGKQSQVARPDTEDGPDFLSKTLNQSGKLGFVDNTLEAPNGGELVLCKQQWFLPLMQSANLEGTRYRFDQPPADPRVTWHRGDTATIGNQLGEWVCLEGGAPGVWAAASWD